MSLTPSQQFNSLTSVVNSAVTGAGGLGFDLVSSSTDLLCEVLSKRDNQTFNSLAVKSAWRSMTTMLFKTTWDGPSADECFEKLSKLSHLLIDAGMDVWQPDETAKHSPRFVTTLLATRNFHSLNLDLLKRILVDNQDTPLEPQFWNGLLARVVRNEAFEKAQWVLQQGIDVNMPDINGKTALFHAVTNSSLDWLLERGADPTHVDNASHLCSFGWPEGRKPDLIRYLVGHKALEKKPEIQSRLAFDGFTRYLMQGSARSVADYVSAAKNFGLKPRSRKHITHGESMIAIAVQASFSENRTSWLRYLLNKKMDLSHESYEGIPDIFLVSLVSNPSYYSSSRRVKDQVEWIKEFAFSNPSLLPFLDHESKAANVIFSFLDHQSLFDNTALFKIWGQPGSIFNLIEQARWRMSRDFFNQKNSTGEVLGWKILSEVSNMDHIASSQGQFNFDLCTKLSKNQDWTLWDPPSIPLTIKIISRLIASPYIEKNVEFSSKFFQIIENAQIKLEPEVIEDLLETSQKNDGQSSHMEIISFLERMKLSHLPSAPKSSRMRI